jgi:hypothetical protein
VICSLTYGAIITPPGWPSDRVVNTASVAHAPQRRDFRRDPGLAMQRRDRLAGKVAPGAEPSSAMSGAVKPGDRDAATQHECQAENSPNTADPMKREILDAVKRWY